jgi:hypothetical protein
LKASTGGDFGEDSVHHQRMKLVQADKQMATSMTIHGSFREAELTPNPSSEPVKLQFDEDRLRENKGFR